VIGPVDEAEHRRGEGAGIAGRHQQSGLIVLDQFRIAFDVGRDHRSLHRESLSECPRDSEAGIGGVHADVAGGQDLGDVGTMAQHGDVSGQAPGGRLVAQDRFLFRVGADEQEPGPWDRRHHGRHRVQHVVVALPAPNPDLGDEVVVAGQAELTTKADPIDTGMEFGGIGGRVDHRDLVGRDALRHQAPLDRFRNGHDRRHARRRIAQPVERIEGKAHAAIQDQRGDLDEQPGHQRERAGPTLVTVNDLDVVTADDVDQGGDRPQIDLGAHRHRVVRQPRPPALLRPLGRRPRGDGDMMAPGSQTRRQVGQLNGRACEIVRLRIDLQNVHRERLPRPMVPPRDSTGDPTRECAESATPLV
jgi:hypothetical protein